MTDTTSWDQLRGIIRTRKGGWVIGEAVYNQGFSMLDDLVGEASYFQVLVLNAVGILPPRKLADWLEALFICLSWPDARIWCNQIGSLAGSLRCSPVAGISAGILASDSRMYGPGTVRMGVDFIRQAYIESRENGATAEQLVENYPRRNKDGVPVIPGFVRPVASGDERIVAMEKVTAKLAFERGGHLDLAFELEKVMLNKFDEGMNLLGYSVAFLLDQLFTKDQIYLLLSTWVSSGVHSCYAEASEATPEAFFPLRCEDIEYAGPPPRPVPSRKLHS